MAKKCIKCGRENDDSSLRCVCEGGVPAEAAIAPAATRTTEPIAQLPSPPDERNLVLRKIGFVVWAIAFVPLFAALRSYLHVPPFYRSLIGTGVFCAPAVAALWFLGGEKHPTLRVWRVGFVLWMIFLVPVLLTMVDGVAAQGWPRGRFNRGIANLLILILTLTVPALLTGHCALLRAYRLTGVLALLTGLVSLVSGVLLLRATSPFAISSLRLVDVLDVVMFGSKVESYLSIPIGIALIVGGIMTLRSARARMAASRATP